MAQIKKRRSVKKMLAQRSSTANHKMLGTTKHKRLIKKRRIIEQTKINIKNNRVIRDIYIKHLRETNPLSRAPLRRAISKQIINQNKELLHDRNFLICAKRRDRRESLFSQKKAGKGIAGPRKKKYTNESKVRC